MKKNDKTNKKVIIIGISVISLALVFSGGYALLKTQDNKTSSNNNDVEVLSDINTKNKINENDTVKITMEDITSSFINTNEPNTNNVVSTKQETITEKITESTTINTIQSATTENTTSKQVVTEKQTEATTQTTTKAPVKEQPTQTTTKKPVQTTTQATTVKEPTTEATTKAPVSSDSSDDNFWDSVEIIDTGEVGGAIDANLSQYGTMGENIIGE